MDERQSTGDGLKNVGDVCGLVSITACLGDAGEGTIAATAHSPASFSSRRVGPNLRAAALAFSASALCLLRCAAARTGAALGARCSARVTPLSYVCGLACSGAFCVHLGTGMRGRQAAREWPAAAIQLLGHHEWTKWLGQSAGGALQTCLPDAAVPHSWMTRASFERQLFKFRARVKEGSFY